MAIVGLKNELSILHVVDSLETGGLERVVSDLAIAQLKRGHRCKVFSMKATEGFRDELERAGVPVFVGNKRGTLDRQLLGKLRDTLREYAVEIVHSHNFVPNYYAALAMTGLRPAPMLVNTCHNMGTRLTQRRLRWLYRVSLLRTSGVAMVGDQVRDHLVAEGIVPAQAAKTVLNGIPIQRFSDVPGRRARARDQLGLDDDALVVGCVGRLVGLKNHAQLLRLLPSLILRYPMLNCVLVGDGPLSLELRHLAERLGVADHVIMPGAIGDIASVLPAFDIFAQPSLTEGVSIAVLEAFASGLAVVASAVGGNVEIIRDGENGCLVTVADDEALSSALDKLLADSRLRECIGASARKWVQVHASVESMRDAYDQFYVDLCSYGK